MPAVPKWRLASAAAVVLALGGLGGFLVPVYIHDFELRRFANHLASDRSKPDEFLRATILDKADSLGLPVRGEDVRIIRSAEGNNIDIQYVVRVNLPLYTVDLHFR